MDILHLVDRLEELFNQSRPIPLTHSVIVDEDRILEIIDQMRISIPEEVKRAQQIIGQRDRVLAQAQEEATRTISGAKKKVEELAGRDAIMQAAQARAEHLIDQARAETETIRIEADEYIIESLSSLEAELTRLLTQTRNGIAKLAAERYQFLENQDPKPPERRTPDPAAEAEPDGAD